MVEPEKKFVDRYGGTIVSIGFHVAVFVLLNLWVVPEAAILKPPEPEPIRIQLSELDPVEGDAEPAQLEAPEAARTIAEDVEVADEPAEAPKAETAEELAPEQGETLEREVAALAPRPEPERPVPPVVTTPLPTVPLEELEPAEDGRLPEPPDPVEESVEDPTEQPQELVGEEVDDLSDLEAAFADRLRLQRQALNTLEQNYAKYGSPEVSQRLSLARAELHGKRWLQTTDGTMEGVIRSLSTTDVAPEIADRVLSRYGIQILYKYLDGNSGGAQNFLNQARTSSGTYHNRISKGHYQVFSFSKAAIARMVQLELAALHERGLDPARTRVLEVEYGIVPTTGGYDLGVTRIDVAPMEFDAEVP